ncbi:MAG: hypothetical protein Q4P78_02250 [Rothia sp. (in: high G+C Gram-positive bacteria)]|uniref:hypothetical protein n=1 Tax=Rothia sp. (in: high G+C Gram-positive bacteria) TaxID=1885016 RepID=UPI0026DFD316|nr:hypothetical protein [Rothia sp. (in: high G+C Gram-positive bacteria)]MDO5750008.1 hypothetical protein [Rothia sp. (in: high G+C Gram-positive bacteria)]
MTNSVHTRIPVSGVPDPDVSPSVPVGYAGLTLAALPVSFWLWNLGAEIIPALTSNTPQTISLSYPLISGVAWAIAFFGVGVYIFFAHHRGARYTALKEQKVTAGHIVTGLFFRSALVFWLWACVYASFFAVDSYQAMTSHIYGSASYAHAAFGALTAVITLSGVLMSWYLACKFPLKL